VVHEDGQGRDGSRLGGDMQTTQTWSFTDGNPPMRPTFLTEAIQTIHINHDEH
jgi:hypothetical protein